jgi:hypothetical protein
MWYKAKKEFMRKKQLLFSGMLLATLSIGSCFVSCSKNQDLYDQEAASGKDESKIFDFSTTQTVKVNINYGYDNYKVTFRIYDVNPLDSVNKTKQPIFAGCTDASSNYTGSITLPAYTSKVYLCSDCFGVPANQEITVSNGEIVYQRNSTSSRGATHIGSCVHIGNNMSNIQSNGGKPLYGLYNSYKNKYWWDNDNWVPSNSNVAGLYSTVNDSQLSDFYQRVRTALQWTGTDYGKIDNSKYATTDEHVNTTIATTTADGEKVDNAHIDLTFLEASGDYQNAMAYYYYPADQKNITANYIKSLPKYFVFPRTTDGMPRVQVKARLQFFGKDYNEAGVDDFPAGYTIGYMLVPDLYNSASGYYGNYYTLSNVNYRIYNNIYYDQAIYSNQIANKNSNIGCITWTDTKTQKVVIGFEDQAFKEKDYWGRVGDNSYEDILFYVDADPVAAIYDPDRPSLPDETPEIEDQTYTRQGTYAFEDIWPNGGDYDLNDVMVEWKTVTTTNDNKISKIEDSFKVAHKTGSATKKNAFGFVINDTYGGTVTSDAPGLTKEEDNQYILFANALNEIGKTYTFTRSFSKGSYPTSQNNERSYNLFIVPDYVAGQKNRTEVHLPKTKATSWANPKLATNENAFYVNADGKYPFAIYLEDVFDFVPVTEGIKIGSAGEYPNFTKWVESSGTNYTDWYKSKQ